MSATQATLAGRRAAEARMLDACTITRVTGSTTDPVTMRVTPTTSAIYTGKCRIRQAVIMDRPADVGGAQQYLQHSIFSLPMAAPSVLTDDLITYTASALTPVLVGRTFHVRALGGDTNATAARYEIIEVTG